MRKSHEIFREMGFAGSSGRLPEAVLYSLGRTTSLLMRDVSMVYKRFGLTAASFNLLMLLKHGTDPEVMTQQAIGKRLVVSASDMTGLIDRLGGKGYAQRLRGKDRRSKLLRITPAGSKVLDAVWPHHLEAVERLGGMVNARQARVLVHALAQLRQAVA